MKIEVTSLADNVSFGAQIAGLDRAMLGDEDIRKQINGIFEDRGVIVFRDIDPTPEMQIAVSNLFGPLQDHPLKEQPRVDAGANVGLMELGDKGTIVERDGVRLLSYVPWHYDACYTAKLNRAGVLRAVEIPPEGGLTGFADGIQLYKCISPELRSKFAGLSIIYHSKLMLMNQRFGVPKSDRWVSLSNAAVTMLKGSEKAPRSVHPAIWRRKTGEWVLHVSPWQAAGIFGQENAEGDALLEELCQEMYAKLEPYWHSWAPTDLIIWDNWRFIHAATGCDLKYARKMHRTTIQGDYGLGRFEHENVTSAPAEMMG